MKKFLIKVVKFFYSNKKSDLVSLSEKEYKESFADAEIAEKSFEKAWAIRNFEIELYWKRATYFWAFIASSFVGYFALINSANYKPSDKHDNVEVYFLICMGFILSVAWLLTNKGSKTWQRHWETHVDLLEDQFTGPLYKTVNPQDTYSVSKINEIVSITFIMIWSLLGVKYFLDKDLINFENYNVNILVLLSSIGTLGLTSAMFFGYGRGRFGERKVSMFRRNVIYEYKKVK